MIKAEVEVAPIQAIRRWEWLNPDAVDLVYAKVDLSWLPTPKRFEGSVTIGDGLAAGVMFGPDDILPLRDFLNRVIEEMERVGGGE